MIKGVAGQSIGAQMLNVTTGANYTSAVTVYITGDGGTQAIGTVGSGVCVHEGLGYHTYTPSAAETNYDLIAFTFIGAAAITATIQVATLTTAQAAAVSTSTATGAISVASLITQAFKRINVIAAGETLSSEDLADGFTMLQYWMDALQTERLSIPFITRTVWTLTSSAGTLTTPYTVGTGGTVDVVRPTFIDQIKYQNTAVSPTLERPIDLLTDEAWQNLPQKDLTGVYPRYAYYNPTYTGLFGSLYLYPTPSASGLQGVLYSPSPISRFTSTADTIVLPPGYLLFIRDNLAVQLAATWRDGIPVDPELARSARESMRQIKRLNVRMADLTLDVAFTTRGAYDINAGP